MTFLPARQTRGMEALQQGRQRYAPPLPPQPLWGIVEANSIAAAGDRLQVGRGIVRRQGLGPSGGPQSVGGAASSSALVGAQLAALRPFMAPGDRIEVPTAHHLAAAGEPRTGRAPCGTCSDHAVAPMVAAHALQWDRTTSGQTRFVGCCPAGGLNRHAVRCCHPVGVRNTCSSRLTCASAIATKPRGDGSVPA